MTGYFCPTCPGTTQPQKVLDSLPAAYDTVIMGFVLFDGKTLDPRLDAEHKGFRFDKAVVSQLQAEGRRVLFSVGGATNPTLQCDEWNADPEVVARFSSEVARMEAEYGFDGFDIDIEQSSRQGSTEACGQLYTKLLAVGAGRVVTVAPEMPDLLPEAGASSPGYNELAKPIAAALPALEQVSVQMYNTWKAAETEEYALRYARELTRGYTCDGQTVAVPAEKLALGFLGSKDAGSSGYLEPSVVGRIVQTLWSEGLQVRIMVFSLGEDFANDWALENAVTSAVSGQGHAVIV